MQKQSDILDGYLVIEFRNGNKRALALLVRRWHDKFCYQAYGYTKNIADAQDIVQDSWQVIINKMGQLKDPNAFKSWAMRIVVRKSIDWVRRKRILPMKSDTEMPDSEASIVENDSRPAMIARLKVGIEQLPEKQKQVLKLFYLQEYNLDEIASILGLSKGTVKSRLFYAREKLKEILKHIS